MPIAGVTFSPRFGLAKVDNSVIGYGPDYRQGIDNIEARLLPVYDGNPNGNVPGMWRGQLVMDDHNKVLWWCTEATGSANDSLWERVLAPRYTQGPDGLEYVGDGLRVQTRPGYGVERHEDGLMVANYISPIGGVISYAGETDPTGWFICDGRPVSRAGFPRLFDVLGTRWGAGNGSTTFNIPDSRGRTLIGAGRAPGLRDRILADKLGEEDHQLTIDEMPEHDHPITLGLAGSHNHIWGTAHTGFGQQERLGYYQVNKAAGSTEINLVTDTEPAHTHPVDLSPVGESRSHNNMQPSLVANWIIRHD